MCWGFLPKHTMKRNLGDTIDFPALPGEPVFVVMPNFAIQIGTLREIRATWIKLNDEMLRRQVTVSVKFEARQFKCSPEYVFETLEEAEKIVAQVKATLTSPVKN
jgi:hypothetical protein